MNQDLEGTAGSGMFRAYAPRHYAYAPTYTMSQLRRGPFLKKPTRSILYVWAYTTPRIPSDTTANDKVLSSHACIGIRNRPICRPSHHSRPHTRYAGLPNNEFYSTMILPIDRYRSMKSLYFIYQIDDNLQNVSILSTRQYLT